MFCKHISMYSWEEYESPDLVALNQDENVVLLEINDVARANNSRNIPNH